MKIFSIFFCLVIVYHSHASILDIFGMTNGHEPRVAINCGNIPFHVDLKTGEWVADSTGVSKCDGDKEEVLDYCKKTYPTLNIVNIVEANHGVEFKTWCKPGSTQCNTVKKVVPYRCLVNEYEADALMVPDGCKFAHLHDNNMCMSHDQWKEKAVEECKGTHKMKLHVYGILLSCKTDLFTGVEFVCCPKEIMKKLRKQAKQAKKDQKKKTISLPTTTEVNKDLFSAAIAKFQKYLPKETKGCDRSNYITKQTEMEDRHRNQIAAVVDEWDDAEKRYNELKQKDPVAAEEKMKRTLEVFRQTLAALEEESKEEKNRLRAEHADCINTQINKDKHDAMIAYLEAIEETPVSAEKILEAVRKFIQVCEHDRVHSLRHFEHVRNRNPVKAENLRGDLLDHLKDLNKVVNESMALLNYLPEIAQQFGINGGGAILKPRKQMPEEEDHSHERVDEILKHAAKVYGIKKATTTPLEPTDDLPVEPKPIRENAKTESAGMNSKESVDQFDAELARKITEQMKKVHKEDDDDDDDDEDEPVIKQIRPSDIIPNSDKTFLVVPKKEEDKEVFARKVVPMAQLVHKAVNKMMKEDEEKIVVTTPMETAPTETTKSLGKVEHVEKKEGKHHKHGHHKHGKHHHKHGGHHGEEKKEMKRHHEDDEETETERHIRYSHKKVGRQERSYAITAILGLSCGILVIMLIVVIAMIIRRRRMNVTRVVLSECNDDREHLVQMQKSGFENPTYKFFYY